MRKSKKGRMNENDLVNSLMLNGFRNTEENKMEKKYGDFTISIEYSYIFNYIYFSVMSDSLLCKLSKYDTSFDAITSSENDFKFYYEIIIRKLLETFE